jgi:hypothetical protein
VDICRPSSLLLSFENPTMKADKRPIFVLGRADHEMRRIFDAIYKREMLCYQAQFVNRTGIVKRIGAATAYKFNYTGNMNSKSVPIDRSKIHVYLIECEPDSTMFMDENTNIHVNSATVPESRRVQYEKWMDIQYVSSIDHHREGDYGFDIGYEGYFDASSLGQVYKVLGISPTEEDYYCAASDHCLSHAYAGHCFNITPAKMLQFRCAVISKGRAIGAVLSDIQEIEAKLRMCNVIEIGGFNVIDGRSINHALVKEAAARMPQPTLIQHYADEKHVCLNSLNPEIIEAWINGYGTKLGYHGCIGMPKRGIGFGTK